MLVYSRYAQGWADIAHSWKELVQGLGLAAVVGSLGFDDEATVFDL